MVSNFSKSDKSISFSLNAFITTFDKVFEDEAAYLYKSINTTLTNNAAVIKAVTPANYTIQINTSAISQPIAVSTNDDLPLIPVTTPPTCAGKLQLVNKKIS